jgi:hypothetical protein
VHRCRNLLAKIPAGMQAEIKDAYWAIFDTEDLKTPPGPRLVEIIDHRIAGLRLLQDLRRSLLEPPRQLRPRTVTAASIADSPKTVSATA